MERVPAIIEMRVRDVAAVRSLRIKCYSFPLVLSCYLVARHGFESFMDDHSILLVSFVWWAAFCLLSRNPGAIK